ncbi:MAG TPA: hypothetical protein VF651_09780 [Gammaproteobacteria bacterium]
MAGKKTVSPAKLQKHARSHAKKAAASAKKRAQHYSKGDKLMKQVSKTLGKIAATHPNPKAKKQAKMALRQLNEAHAAFGSASMCADTPTYNNKDT